MKRSEMLMILNDAVIKSGISEKLYNHVDQLDYVLTKLEESGMIPPEYNVNEGSGEYNIPSYYVSDWEPEDGK